MPRIPQPSLLKVYIQQCLCMGCLVSDDSDSCQARLLETPEAGSPYLLAATATSPGVTQRCEHIP